MLENFTILIPGGCNAKCSFCPDSMEGKPPTDWLLKLADAMSVIPKHWDQVSFSGGEPTISPYLKQSLQLVRPFFSKTVLTTSGIKLLDVVDVIGQYVDHLNISRHGFTKEQLQDSFKTKRVVSDAELTKAIQIYKEKYLGDINLNHVYLSTDKHIDKGYLLTYVKYAKSLGADSVSFRYDQRENSMEETFLEGVFKQFTVVHSGGCPVCRSHTIIVDDLPVTFKASFQEPSNAYKTMGNKELYELIFHTSGILSTDWEGKNVYIG